MAVHFLVLRVNSCRDRAGRGSTVDPGSWRLKEPDPAYELGRKMNCLVVGCAYKAAKEKLIPARPLLEPFLQQQWLNVHRFLPGLCESDSARGCTGLSAQSCVCTL